MATFLCAEKQDRVPFISLFNVHACLRVQIDREREREVVVVVEGWGEGGKGGKSKLSQFFNSNYSIKVDRESCYCAFLLCIKII